MGILRYLGLTCALLFGTCSYVLAEEPKVNFKYSISALDPSKLIGQAELTNFKNIETPLIKLRSSGKNVFRKVFPSVVKILTNDGSGSGVIISSEDNGYILTNDHVVSGSNTVGIQFSDDPDGAKLSIGTVMMFDQISDLALINLNSYRSDLNVISIAVDEIFIGENVHAIGHPLGEDWTYTRGYVSQKRQNYTWQTDITQHHVANIIQTQTPINPGNSGGPLVNDNGELVGLNTFGKMDSQGLNYSIANSSIEKFLNSEGNIKRSSINEKEYTLGIIIESWDDNKNGHPDAYGFDASKNEVVDLIAIDTEEDLTLDILLFDENENGIFELVIYSDLIDGQEVVIYDYDKDEDEEIESRGVDTDQDGKIDYVVPVD